MNKLKFKHKFYFFKTNQMIRQLECVSDIKMMIVGFQQQEE